MKKFLPLIILCIFCTSCEKNQQIGIQKNSNYIARIVSYDPNCSTCILQFPNDSVEIKKIAGESPNNLYEAINLNKNEFQVGQLITVKLRKPEKNELKACPTLFTSFPFKGIFVTEVENSEELLLNDTIVIFNKTCKFNSENQFYLCLDSILEDSRCPTGALCIWEGDARVRFHFEKIYEQPLSFILHTNPKGTTEINIDRYKISLINLYPYPSINNRVEQGPRRAELIIKEIK
jgi:hypothetical protein